MNIIIFTLLIMLISTVLERRIIPNIMLLTVVIFQIIDEGIGNYTHLMVYGMLALFIIGGLLYDGKKNETI